MRRSKIVDMLRTTVVALVASLSPSLASIAAADEHVEIGANFVVQSENNSREAAGHPGGQAQVTTWWNAIGLGVEVGHMSWAEESKATYASVGVKAALSDSSKCNRDCAGFRTWFDVGVGREWWTIDQPDVMAADRSRNFMRVGIGMDVIRRNGLIGGGTIFFRIQRGEAVDSVAGVYRDAVGPYETNAVFGIGAMFGAF